MHNKKYNGNNPLQGNRLEGKKGTNTSDALARAEIEISKRTPRHSMTSGSLATQNGTFHAPKRMLQRGAGVTCRRWFLSVRKDSETEQWYFKIGLGLLNDVRSAQFDEDTDAYEAAITVVGDIQVGLKVQLKAPVNAALYVMPGSDPTFPELPDTPADMLTFVEAEFADYEFTDTDLPNGTTAEGFAVLPIGKIAYDTEAQTYSVEERKLKCDVNGIFSPVNGYVVYESVL